jgi:hypothetical protein
MRDTFAWSAAAGAEAVTDALIRDLGSGWWGSVASRPLAVSIKEQLCSVSSHAREVVNDALSSPPQTAALEHELPDGTRVKLCSSMLARAGEVMFSPPPLPSHETADATARPGGGLVDVVASALYAVADVEARRRIFSSFPLVVAGGGAALVGLRERLTFEVAAVGPADVTPPAVVTLSHGRTAAWLGGSIVARLSTFRSACVTKQDYDEHGAPVVNMHFGF